MNLRAAWLAVVAASAASLGAAGTDGTDASAVGLNPGRPEEVYVAPGRATTVLLRTGRKVSAITVASPIVTYKYDKALNQIEITPAVRTGGVETNMNLRIGDEVYVLLLKVVADVRVEYLRCFTIPSDAAADDEAEMAKAPPLKPAEVDIIGASGDLERAISDPVFRKARSDLRLEAIGRSHSWNGCAVMLDFMVQYADRDLLVFRVRWVNATPDALFLDPAQYALFAGEVSVPIIARYKVGSGAVVYPGRVETVYLAVQGYRLSRRNDWRLDLPPDAVEVGRAMEAAR